MRRCWAMVALVVALAACGGDEEQTETPSTGTDPPTVEQYAAIVSQRTPELVKVLDTANECLDGYAFPCNASEATAIYRITLQTSLLAGELGHGTVPEEIEDLHERTMAAAESAELQAQVFTDGNCGPQPDDSSAPAESCTEAAHNALLANGELKAALLAWEPYTGKPQDHTSRA